MALTKSEKLRLSEPRLADDRLRVLETFPPFGIVLKGVEFTGTTARRVNHGLEYPPNGYIVVRVRFNRQVLLYEATDSDRPETFLNLTNSVGTGSTVTKADIWFF